MTSQVPGNSIEQVTMSFAEQGRPTPAGLHKFIEQLILLTVLIVLLINWLSD
jgi:hypothetical protein